MKSATRTLTRLQFDHLYSAPFALHDLATSALLEVPAADYIRITVIDLEKDKEVPGQAALFTEAEVRSSVREPVLQSERES